jgi:drug/metabolite transporter (DMT)-like permease
MAATRQLASITNRAVPAGGGLSSLDLTLTARQSLWMLVASLCFAAMGVCVKLGSSVFSAAELVFYRSLIATLILFAYIRWRGWPLKSRHWRAQINRGVSGFVSQVLYFFAIGALPLATAVTLNYTSPLFFAMFLGLWSGQRLHASVVGALALGFVGVAVLLQPTLNHDQLLPALVALGSGLLAGVAYFNVRRLGQLGEPEWRTVFYFSFIATLAGTPWVLSSQPFHHFDGRGIALLLGVGVFGAVAQLAMTRAYRYGKTLVSASLAYSTVIFSTLFGALLWSEVPSPASWLGIAVIIASGVMASMRSRVVPVEQD